MANDRSARYRVVHLRTGDVWDFATADEVSVLLFGRYLPDYAIYKNGVRWKRRIGGEITAYAAALGRWEPEPNEDDK